MSVKKKMVDAFVTLYPPAVIVLLAVATLMAHFIVTAVKDTL